MSFDCSFCKRSDLLLQDPPIKHSVRSKNRHFEKVRFVMR